MKKFLLILLFCTTTYVAMQAQERRNIIKTAPVSLAFGNFNVGYERVLNASSSVLVKANYFYQLGGIKVNTFGAGVAYRYYFTHKKVEVPTGFYINPQAGFAFGSPSDDEDTESASFSTFSLGAELGYQWAWDSGFTLDLGAGPNFTFLGGDYEDIDFSYSGATVILPSLTVAIGYAF